MAYRPRPVPPLRAGDAMAHYRFCARASRNGYTAIEMMVVLTVASALLAIGVPGLRGIVQSQKIATTVSDLFAAAHLARSEAIQRGARVDLVPAGDGTDWTKGWVVLI